MTTLEAAARKLWEGLSSYAKFTFCAGCGESRYCRAKKSTGPYVCLDCFDQNGRF